MVEPNVPRPCGVGLGRPHADLKTLKRTEQPGPGFCSRALPQSRALSSAEAGRTHCGLWLQCSGSGRQGPAGDQDSTGLGIMWPGSCLSSFLFPHSFLGGLVPSERQGAGKVRRADMAGTGSAARLCCESVGPSLLMSFPGPERQGVTCEIAQRWSPWSRVSDQA